LSNRSIQKGNRVQEEIGMPWLSQQIYRGSLKHEVNKQGRARRAGK